jgi:hypothetical protein
MPEPQVVHTLGVKTAEPGLVAPRTYRLPAKLKTESTR